MSSDLVRELEGLIQLVEQAPLTPDNGSARFPFWDTSNGADNRQVFYTDLVGSF